jgi:hypothetical protein
MSWPRIICCAPWGSPETSGKNPTILRPAWRHRQSQSLRALRNPDGAGRGRMAGASLKPSRLLPPWDFVAWTTEAAAARTHQTKPMMITPLIMAQFRIKKGDRSRKIWEITSFSRRCDFYVTWRAESSPAVVKTQRLALGNTERRLHWPNIERALFHCPLRADYFRSMLTRNQASVATTKSPANHISNKSPHFSLPGRRGAERAPT